MAAVKKIITVARKYPLRTLFIFALGLRLLFFIQLRPWNPEVEREIVMAFDGIEYHTLGQSIAFHGSYSILPDGSPYELRTPVYPFFIALIYRLFGPHPWIVILFQLFLDAGAAVILYKLCCRLFKGRIPLIAGVLYAIDPFLIYYSNTLMSDSVFVFTLVCSAYALTNLLQQNHDRISPWKIILAGGLFGLCALVKPIALYLLLFLAPGGFILHSGRKNVAKFSFIFTASFVLAISPWLVRNIVEFNTPMLSDSASRNLLVLDVPPLLVEKQHLDDGTVYELLVREADSLAAADGEQPATMNGFEKARYWKRTALKYIHQEPALFAKYYVKGIVQLFVNLETKAFTRALHLRGSNSGFAMLHFTNPVTMVRQWWNEKTTAEISLGALVAVYLCLLYGFSLWGLARSFHHEQKVFLSFCVMMILYFVVFTGVAGAARFRLPILPFLFVFTAIGINAGFKRRNGVHSEDSEKNHLTLNTAK
jgi:4-amino-4-deoxy-L-arabinose transferase-like glycosyltransferase